MPTYEYECTGCGQHIEVFQRFSEDSLTTCRNCGGALRKVFHPAGIVFKGSGFYATDSRSKKATASSSKKDGSSAKGDATPGSSGTGSSSEGSSSGGGGSGDSGSAKAPSASKDPS